MTTGRDVARAVDALRRGWAVTIDGTAFLAVESADEAALAEFDAVERSSLLISGPRAVTLKLANQRDAVPTAPVLIARAPWIDLAEAVAIGDPARDLANPLKGPFRACPPPPGAEAAVQLTRLAGLLPALFAGGSASEDSLRLDGVAIAEAVAAPRVSIASRARLPIAAAERAEVVAFRSTGDPAEHIALLIGQPTGAPPLVRLHSECLTGDVLGSLKCDCGPQLDGAIEAIASSGWGILLYLRQEGRGIGLINKLRAYALQDQGFDTVDANLRLGFGDDERSFVVAARMLEALGQQAVRLLTNNPRKVAGLEAAGIAVAERVPLQRGRNPHNQAYLDTKRSRSGHEL